MKVETYITRGVDAAIKQEPKLLDFIQNSYMRFVRNEWGDCYKEDAELNDSDPLTAMGVYMVPFDLDLPGYHSTDRIWIKSDDYSDEQKRVITILFPDEW